MNTVATQTKSTSFPRLAAWAIGSGVALVVGTVATLPVLWSIGENAEKTIGQVPALTLGGAFFGLGIGTAVGFAQWLVLRGREKDALRWLVGSVVGGIVAGIVGVWVSGTYSEGGENLWANGAAFALLGAILGAGQYLAARSIPRNPLWILASTLGLAIGTLSIFGIGNFEGIGNLVGAFAYGIVTAIALWWFTKE